MSYYSEVTHFIVLQQNAFVLTLPPKMSYIILSVPRYLDHSFLFYIMHGLLKASSMILHFETSCCFLGGRFFVHFLRGKFWGKFRGNCSPKNVWENWNFPRKKFKKTWLFLRGCPGWVGNKPRSSRFHLLSHFHHFTAKPQVSKNRFPEKLRGKFRGKSLSAEKNVRKIGPWRQFDVTFFSSETS
jgi:hypothetical protein